MAETTILGGGSPPPACLVCAGPVRLNRQFCSQACQWQSMRTRPTLVCKGCGSKFLKRRRGNDAQAYCSRPCADRSRRKWSSRQDRRRAEKSAKRDRRRQASGAGVTVPCARCSVSFVRKKKHQRFCSIECRLPKVRRPVACRQCGKEFIPDHGHGRYCSVSCDRARKRKSRPKGGRKDRDRARRYGVRYEPINRAKLYERDGWRCQVCGCRTPKALRGKLAPNAPELDHRVPLCRGGNHTWDNVQTACRRCNAAKGGVRVVGQMALFPHPGGGTVKI